MSQDPTHDFLQFTIRGIEAEYETAVWEAKETIRRAEERRDRLIAEARSWVQGKSSAGIGLSDTIGKMPSPFEEAPHTNGGASDGSSEADGDMVSKDVVRKFVGEVMADPNVEIVTQPLIKDRILAHYSVSQKYINNLRILIIYPLNELVEQGYLELVKQARAGKPNEYRKTGKLMEANLLEP